MTETVATVIGRITTVVSEIGTRSLKPTPEGASLRSLSVTRIEALPESGGLALSRTTTGMLMTGLVS